MQVDNGGWINVNGAKLEAFVNKKVSIVGFVIEKAPNGLSFDMRTTDNLIVKINMQQVIDHPLQGYVEVHGISTGKGVRGDELIVFSNVNFDAKAYNKLCTILTSVPNLWNTL